MRVSGAIAAALWRVTASALVLLSAPFLGEVALLSAQPQPQRFPNDFDQLFAAVELGPDRVLLTEKGEQRPFIVEWRTGARSSIGSVGKGPREFLGPRRLYALTASHVVIEDPYRYTFYPWVEGRVQEGLNLRVVRHGYSQQTLAGADTAGRFLFVSAHRLGRTPGLRHRYNAKELVAVVGTRGNARLDTVTTLRGSFRAETSVYRMTVGRRLE
ncbi:hypothetical protein [Gemmatimonas sp.]